jgi:hypothetical protein
MAQVAVTKLMLDHAFAEARAKVREVGGWNAGPRVDMYEEADTLPGKRYAWCQSFLNAIHRLATGGVIVGGKIVGGEMLMGGTASVGLACAEARKRGLLVSRPQRGDIFGMQLDSNSWPDHTGIILRVISVGVAGFLCQTVEGNTGSGSVDEGDGVYVRTRLLSRRTIFYRVPGKRTVVRGKTHRTVLTKRTGFFSWASWRLGEGAWKGYGRANPSVRPNVPKRISPAWLKRLTSMLRNRKKGSK